MISEADQPWIVHNLGVVATFFRVQPGTVRGDWRQAGMPGTRGRWDLQKIMEWKFSRGGDPVAPRARANGNGKAPRNKLEEEKLAEDVRYKRLKNDLTEGELVYRRDSDLAWNTAMHRIRARLEMAPDEMEPHFPEEVRKTAKSDFDAFIRQLLQEMSHWDPVEVG
jgi:phage terminase Nu1 subunit (DNA packaging protein)